MRGMRVRWEASARERTSKVTPTLRVKTTPRERVGCPASVHRPSWTERVRSERSARDQVPNATTRRTSSTVHSEIRPMLDHRRRCRAGPRTNEPIHETHVSSTPLILNCSIFITIFIRNSKLQLATQDMCQVPRDFSRRFASLILLLFPSSLF